MNRLCKTKIVIFLSLIFCYIEFVCGDFVERQKALDYWDATRKSDVVIKGIVTNIDEIITINISTIYKGSDKTKTISFATPPSSEKYLVICPAPYRFTINETCIVFLQQSGIDKYKLYEAATGNTEFVNLVEQTIQDVFKLDSLSSDLDKCKMLISLISPYKGLQSAHAFNELSNKYNKEEYFELFEPLEHEPSIQLLYIGLLGANPHPSATIKLREFLQTNKKDDVLLKLISQLTYKDTQNVELSKELLKYITHSEPIIRRDVIFALDYRNYYDALPEITKCFDDESPIVRESALRYIDGWVKKPEILAKIKQLTFDKNEEVRAEAYHALLRDSSQIRGIIFYKILLASLFDKSERVRRIASRLDLSWERMPLRISLLLLWPSIVLIGFVFYIHRDIRWSQRIKIIIKSVVSGYISGAIAGYFIGLYHSQNPIFHSIILIPPLFIPFGILLSAGISKIRWKTTMITFFMFVVFISVIIYIITSCNTLWPCILIGSILLGTISYFQKSALILPGNNQKQH